MNKPKVILDSGAYTVHKKGSIINIDDYAEYVRNNGYLYENCFNLDHIGDGQKSYENWMYLKRNGVNTIPVYHIGTDEIWLKKYLDATDYVGLGAVASINDGIRRIGLEQIWKKYLHDSEGKPKIKVHGLGITSFDIMRDFPWYSVDSSSMVIFAAWGGVCLPKIVHNGVNGKFDFTNLVYYKISDQVKHVKSSGNKFLNLPKRIQNAYREMLESHGFTIGNVEYQKRRMRSLKNLRVKEDIPPLFDIISTTEEIEKTLANDWLERLRWNLTCWNLLKENLPASAKRMIIYIGGITNEIKLKTYSQVFPKHDILVSFSYMTEKLQKEIEEYTKNS